MDGVDRATRADLLNLAVDVGPLPMQAGACLILSPAHTPGFDVARARRLIGERIRVIPRLQRKLVRPPFGRPLWIDDPSFDVDQHVRVTRCPGDGDERALLDLAVEVIGTPLPQDRPLWSMTLVTGLRDDGVGLIVCFHHVLSDGIGGLAVLAGLVDGAPPPPPAVARRSRTRPRRRIPRLFAVPRAARCSLNQPTGRRQRLAVVTTPLDDVRLTAHAHGGTVNDVVLAAVTGAVATLLEARGEAIPALVASVPVSARVTDTTGRLGNDVGVMFVTLPMDADRASRLARTAAITRAGKAAARPRGSAEVVAAANRVFARLHVMRWMLNHQHLMHTSVSNMRGPEQPLTLAGAPVQAIVPISLVRGNVTVAFTVLSYAGTLTVTITADADRVPDLPVLVAALEAELKGAVPCV
jgi:diacylglycerol O-acyltransferase / wax synthase